MNQTLERKTLGKTGRQVSPFGFGTYRVDDQTPAHREALTQALLSGVNLIDTSTNYTDGGAEILIGSVVSELEKAGKLRREDLVIVTKAGYVQGSNLELAMLRLQQRKPFPEMVQYTADCWHCISPEFLAIQIQRSLARLQSTKLDVLLLHNPEYFLKTNPDHAEYYRRIREAFLYLETEVARGTIGWYGVSSNTFGLPKESPEFTSLEVLLDLAEAIQADHHFAVIQFPFNLFEAGGAFEKNNSGKTVLDLARAKNIGVLTNRPLNSFHEGNLLRLAGRNETAAEISEDTSEAEDLENDLQETLSHLMALESNYPEEAQVPASRISWGHAIRKNFEAISTPESWQSLLLGKIEPAIGVVLEQLSANPATLPWAEEYRFRANELFEAVTAYVEHRAAVQAREVSAKLSALCPELSSSQTISGESLSAKVLRLYASIPEISCVLVGQRRPEYVSEVLAVSKLPVIERSKVEETLRRIDER